MISLSFVSSVFIWISFWFSEILFFNKLISSRSSFIASLSCRISVSIDLIFLFVFYRSHVLTPTLSLRSMMLILSLLFSFSSFEFFSSSRLRFW